MKLLLLSLFLAGALFGQENVSRVIKLTNINPVDTQAVMDIMSAGKVRWQAQDGLRIIVLHGPLELVDAIEAAVKKLDVPRVAPPAPKNIELTFHILAAGGTGLTSAIPADLVGVVQQLGNVFGLKSFRLLETTVMRGRDGRGMEGNGVIAIPVKVDASPRYYLRLQKVTAPSAESGRLIRIDGLDFRVDIPYSKVGAQGLDWLGAGIKTDMDLREGQKVVVGKSSLDASGQVVFLVVTAKVVD